LQTQELLLLQIVTTHPKEIAEQIKNIPNIIFMSSFVFGFQDIDKTKLDVVGGKGVNLGELTRIEGIHVPVGFCISTEAFKRIIGEKSSINELLDQLSLLKVEDRDKIGELSGEIRRVIEGIAIPQDIN
jgi:rifampicin phosphotransferase